MLRRNQAEFLEKIRAEWNKGNRAVFGIAPCGFGKTVCFSDLMARESGVCLAMAHRRELISQMSFQLARNGIRHRVIGPKSLIQKIVRKHMQKLKRSYYDPSARIAVASVDSIKLDDPVLKQCVLVIPDEGHHVLRENKWGRVISAMNENVRMFLPTATCFRSDGKGLGRHADGFGDAIVYADGMRQLIRDGYSLDYRIAMPESDYRRPDESEVGPSGEIRPEAARASVHRSKRIVGDIVEWYCKLAWGLLGLTFAVDIESAVEIAAKYKAAGVPAEVITGTTDPDYRDAVIERFERREVWQIVNVGIAGEGTDIPGVEVISMGAPTEAKGWFDQMFGRGSRLLITEKQMQEWDIYTRAVRLAIIASSAKPSYLVIDHCGNVMRHLPPDSPRVHTLNRRDRRAKSAPSDDIPIRMCLFCAHPTPRHIRGCEHCKDRPFDPRALADHLKTCAHCHEPEPAGRGKPEEVDGDPFELDAAALAALRGEIAAVMELPVLYGPPQGRMAMQTRHHDRFAAQGELREVLTEWFAFWRVGDRSESECYRRFYFQFGVDYLTAQTLGAADANALAERVRGVLPI